MTSVKCGLPTRSTTTWITQSIPKTGLSHTTNNDTGLTTCTGTSKTAQYSFIFAEKAPAQLRTQESTLSWWVHLRTHCLFQLNTVIMVTLNPSPTGPQKTWSSWVPNKLWRIWPTLSTRWMRDSKQPSAANRTGLLLEEVTRVHYPLGSTANTPTTPLGPGPALGWSRRSKTSKLTIYKCSQAPADLANNALKL